MDQTTVFLKPAFFSHIWGGTLLRDYFGKPTGDNTGESWEVSAQGKGESHIDGGRYDGLDLSEYIGRLGKDFWGDQPAAERFPLLIKLIGAKEKLSVQVHPSDDNCAPGESGKAEAWVVLQAPPQAQLVFGTRCGREEFNQALEEGRIADTLRYLPVKAGDVLNIEAGRLHAITENMVIYEIQQNSDTTYRFYDWDRVDAATGRPRELHVDRAMAVTDFDTPNAGPVQGLKVSIDGQLHTFYICNDLFALEKIEVSGRFADVRLGCFATYTLVEGHGTVEGRAVKPGDTMLTPACGSFLFEGEGVLLKGWAPGRARLADYLHQLGQQDLSAVAQLG